jgi:hypothetical protein
MNKVQELKEQGFTTDEAVEYLQIEEALARVDELMSFESVEWNEEEGRC